MEIDGFVYKYTNKINGKVYIGQTIREHSRYCEHKNAKGDSTFHNAIKKYGFDNFEYEIIAYADTKEMLNYVERYYIRKYNAFAKNGYNMTKGGDGRLGFHQPQYVRDAVRKAHLGKVVSEETRRKMSISGKGKHNHKGELNPNWRGGKKEKEYVPRELINQHISEAKKGCTPWNKGKHWSDDMKQKFRLAALNRAKKNKITYE